MEQRRPRWTVNDVHKDLPALMREARRASIGAGPGRPGSVPRFHEKQNQAESERGLP